MHTEAFETLGIAPTVDGRAIRAAFVRLARIYHPDRFVDQPEEVRLEAERRMKDAAAAYELLRSAGKAAPPEPAKARIDDKELEERARKYRAAAEAREQQDQRNRARWMRWEAIERDARRKAEAEAEIAARIKNMDGTPAQPSPTSEPKSSEPRQARPLQPASSEYEEANYVLAERLKAARGIRATGLRPRVAAAE